MPARCDEPSRPAQDVTCFPGEFAASPPSARARPNANGAGIAADPTLTSAWSSFRVPPGGGSLPEALGARCLSACPKARVLSPALAPASGSIVGRSAIPGLDPFLPTLGSIDFPAAVRSLEGRSFRFPSAEASVSLHSRPVSPGRVSELPHPGHQVGLRLAEAFCKQPSQVAGTVAGTSVVLEILWFFNPFG